jgi:hypothetical protein
MPTSEASQADNDAMIYASENGDTPECARLLAIYSTLSQAVETVRKREHDINTIGTRERV